MNVLSETRFNMLCETMTQEEYEATRQIFERTRQLLEAEGSWIQGSWARVPNGNSCSEFLDKACSFCLSGAIGRAIHELSRANAKGLDLTPEDYTLYGLHGACADMARLMLEQVVGCNTVQFNDTDGRKQEEVLDALDQAIVKITSALESAKQSSAAE